MFQSYPISLGNTKGFCLADGAWSQFSSFVGFETLDKSTSRKDIKYLDFIIKRALTGRYNGNRNLKLDWTVQRSGIDTNNLRRGRVPVTISLDDRKNTGAKYWI